MQQNVYFPDLENDDSKGEDEDELESRTHSACSSEGLDSVEDIESMVSSFLLRSQSSPEFEKSIPWKNLKRSK